MVFIILIFGLMTFIAGLLTLINPELIFGYLRNNLEKASLQVLAISMRAVLGILLILHAGQSRFPSTIGILGWVSIAAAVTFLCMGRRHFLNLMSWALSLLKPYGRIGGIFAMAFGGFLIYAFSPALYPVNSFAAETNNTQAATVPIKTANTYERALQVWRTPEDLNTWIAANFSYDPASLNRFRAELKIGSCRNFVLQDEWNQFGPDVFEFKELEVLEPLDDPAYDPGDDLIFLEAHWVEKLKPYGDKGYNKPPKPVT